MLLLFLTLPALTLATIRVNILGTFDGGNSNFTAYVGNDDVATISDKDRNAFHLNDTLIKKSYEISIGKSPDQVFVKNPTPYGDLYRILRWKQVQRTTALLNAGLTSVSTKTEVVAEEILQNNSTDPMTVNITLSKQIRHSMFSFWPSFDDVSVSGIQYKFNFDVKGSIVNFDREFAWGERRRQSTLETLGSGSESLLRLQPGQNVTAQLISKRGIVIFSFDYVTSLANDAIANYDTAYKDQHFHRVDVNSVLRTISLAEKLKTTNKVLLSFYYDARIIVKDNKSDAILMDKQFSRSTTQDSNRLSGHAVHRNKIPSGKKIAFTLPDEGLSTDVPDLADWEEIEENV